MKNTKTKNLKRYLVNASGGDKPKYTAHYGDAYKYGRGGRRLEIYLRGELVAAYEYWNSFEVQA